MKKKIWYKVTISTEEQNVEVHPTEAFDGIIVEIKELDGKTGSSRLYLNDAEMECLVSSMRDVMRHVKG